SPVSPCSRDRAPRRAGGRPCLGTQTKIQEPGQKRRLGSMSFPVSSRQNFVIPNGGEHASVATVGENNKEGASYAQAMAPAQSTVDLDDLVFFSHRRGFGRPRGERRGGCPLVFSP